MAKKPEFSKPPMPTLDDDQDIDATDAAESEPASTPPAKPDEVLREIRKMGAPAPSNPVTQYECGIYPELVQSKKRLAEWVTKHAEAHGIQQRKLYSDNPSLEDAYQRFCSAAVRCHQKPVPKQMYLAALILMDRKVPLEPPQHGDPTNTLNALAQRMQLTHAVTG